MTNAERWKVGSWAEPVASLLSSAYDSVSSQDLDAANITFSKFWTMINQYWSQAYGDEQQADLYTLTGKALWTQGFALQIYQGQLVARQASTEEVSAAGQQSKKAFDDSATALSKAVSLRSNIGIDSQEDQQWQSSASSQSKVAVNVTTGAVNASKDTQAPGIMDILSKDIPGLGIPLWVIPAGAAVFFLWSKKR